MKLHGHVWKFGDGLRALDIVPPDYDELGMAYEWQACAKHLFEQIEPRFAQEMRAGDIVIAGEGLGAGHAHYYMAAIMASKVGGVGAMLCESVNTLFQRAAIDQGFPVWSMPGIHAFVSQGDMLEIDLVSGDAHNRTTGQSAAFTPISSLILDIVAADGSLNWAMQRVGKAESVA